MVKCHVCTATLAPCDMNLIVLATAAALKQSSCRAWREVVFGFRWGALLPKGVLLQLRPSVSQISHQTQTASACLGAARGRASLLSMWKKREQGACTCTKENCMNNMYTHTHTSIHLSYTYIHTYVRTYIHTYMDMHTHMHNHVFVPICFINLARSPTPSFVIYVSVCLPVCLGVRVSACMSARASLVRLSVFANICTWVCE